MGLDLSRTLAAAAVLALAVLTGCSSTTEPPTPAADNAIPFSSPTGGSQPHYDVDDFDTCSPFASTLCLKAAVVDRQLAPLRPLQSRAAVAGGAARE